MYRHGILEMQVCEKMGHKLSANTTTSLTSESCRKSNAQNLAASLVFCCFAKNPADLNFTPPLSVFTFFSWKRRLELREMSRGFVKWECFPTQQYQLPKGSNIFLFFSVKKNGLVNKDLCKLTKLFLALQSLAFSGLDILTAKALAACTIGATPRKSGKDAHHEILQNTEKFVKSTHNFGVV